MSERFTGGHLVFLEGLFFYTRWKETDDYWIYSGGLYIERPVEYQYTSNIYAAIASYNNVSASGLSFGISVGLLGASSSRKLVSGQDPYPYSSSNSASSASMSLIGPRVGYYFTKFSGRITPFAAFEYDIISGSYNYSQNMMRIGGGVLVRVAPSAGISVGVDYVDISDLKMATNVMVLVGMNFIFK